MIVWRILFAAAILLVSASGFLATHASVPNWVVQPLGVGPANSLAIREVQTCHCGVLSFRVKGSSGSRTYCFGSVSTGERRPPLQFFESEGHPDHIGSRAVLTSSLEEQALTILLRSWHREPRGSGPQIERTRSKVQRTIESVQERAP